MSKQLKCELEVLEEVKKRIQLARHRMLCEPSSGDSDKNLYPEGVLSIHKKIDESISRMYWSMLEMKIGEIDNFQVAEDNALTAIENLCTLVAYLRGEVEGQDKTKDIFNGNHSKSLPKNYRAIWNNSDTVTTKPNSENIIQKVISEDSSFEFFRHFNGA